MKLRNKGDEAFRHSDYGDVITIARTIIKDGPAPYKIRNEKGKVVSSKKEDIVAICDHFQLEVDNPMAILTQDTARKFLADSSAKEKYKFFLKGTQLDRLTENNGAIHITFTDSELTELTAASEEVKVMGTRYTEPMEKSTGL